MRQNKNLIRIGASSPVLLSCFRRLLVVTTHIYEFVRGSIPRGASRLSGASPVVLLLLTNRIQSFISCSASRRCSALFAMLRCRRRSAASPGGILGRVRSLRAASCLMIGALLVAASLRLWPSPAICAGDVVKILLALRGAPCHCRRAASIPTV